MQRHLTSRRKALGLIGGAMAWPLAGRAAEPLDTLTGHAFGTTWRLTGDTSGNLESMRRDVGLLFAGIDHEMSPWRMDSTISNFNRMAPADMPVSPELARVAKAALKLAEDSGGVFDPTVGPLVARWGFGPIEGRHGSGWTGLTATENTIAKSEASLTLDLCGIAKGRALDRVSSLAKAQGAGNLLFDLGGELSALGRHPSGRAWRVAVENPVAGEGAPAIIELPAGKSVATSGVRSQSYGLNGRTWSHIIDPSSETPAAGRLRSVTVLAEDAMTADGWATALFAAGDANGPALAEKRRIAALFLFEDGAALRQVRTGGIEDFLVGEV